eukprot:Gb_11528 [translate_table: standard]
MIESGVYMSNLFYHLFLTILSRLFVRCGIVKGFVLEKEKPREQNGSRKGSSLKEGGLDAWTATAAFQNITYWNHDTVPSESDTFNCCFHWFALANALQRQRFLIVLCYMRA